MKAIAGAILLLVPAGCAPRGEPTRGMVTAASPSSLDLSDPIAFTRSAAARLNERLDAVEAKEVGEKLTLMVRVSGELAELRLDHVWRACVNIPAACDREVGLLGGALRDSMTKEGLRPDMLLGAMCSPFTLAEMASRGVQSIESIGAGHVGFVYMIDFGSGARTATEADFARLGVDRAAARKQVGANLSRRLGPLSSRLKRGPKNINCLTRGELYESSTTLEMQAWAAVAEQDAPWILSIPASDTLCYAWKADRVTTD